MHSLPDVSQQKHKTLSKKNEVKQKPSRASRTRTLIQLGGLVDKSGLTCMFGIQTGDDLQSVEHIDKAAVLLGFLCYVCDNIDNNSLENYSLWRSRGLTMLRDKRK